jgi:hypothetical protein
MAPFLGWKLLAIGYDQSNLDVNSIGNKGNLVAKIAHGIDLQVEEGKYFRVDCRERDIYRSDTDISFQHFYVPRDIFNLQVPRLTLRSMVTEIPTYKHLEFDISMFYMITKH